MAGRIALALIAAGSLGLSGCATTNAKRTIGTLAGSSVGAAAGKAIGASGALGYAASIATTALGGFAGTQVIKLFGGKAIKMQEAALVQALDAQPIGKPVTWGTEGKPPAGYAAVTGPVFAAATGGSCRAFRLVTIRQKGMLSSKLVDGLQNARSAIEKGQSAAGNLSNISNVGDAVSGAQDAAGAATNAADAAKALSAGANGPPVADPVLSLPVDKEMFGTACKDKKDSWAVVKT
jgi:hypothetical protein